MSADVIMQNPVLYSDYDSSIVGVNPEQDQRALQIALQLSNLALLGYEDSNSYDDIMNNKKTHNMTECVPVPSSEHVAEIVGKQGCKIKALRAKTNTYIKTPVRGEEPVFVVTGRKEDVALARREVQSAAEHFTQIRASRNRHAMLASQALGNTSTEECPGTITLQVRVPYRVVGLVVGPKGATIKRIQQQTHTYIVTPSREKEPVFEVTGLPENVEKAKEEIEAHIATRTGSHHASIDDDFKNNGTEVGSPSTNTDCIEAAISAPFQTNTAFPYNAASKSMLRSNAPSFYPTNATVPAVRQNSALNQAQMLPSNSSPAIDGTKDVFLGYSVPEYAQISERFKQPNNTMRQSSTWSVGGSGQQLDNSSTYSFQSLFSSSSCFGGSERGNSMSPTSSVSAQFSRMSPTFSEKDFPALPSMSSTNNFRYPVNRVASEEFSTSSGQVSDSASVFSSTATPAVNIESGYSSGGTCDSIASGSPTILNPALSFNDMIDKKPPCLMCGKSTIAAALVPCGHHWFCLSCADEIVKKQPAVCPCCHMPANMALPIKK